MRSEASMRSFPGHEVKIGRIVFVLIATLFIMISFCRAAKAGKVLVPWKTRMVIANMDSTVPATVFRAAADITIKEPSLHDSLDIDKKDVGVMRADKDDIDDALDVAADDYEKVCIFQLRMSLAPPPLDENEKELSRYLIKKKTHVYTITIFLYDCATKELKQMYEVKSSPKDLQGSLRKAIADFRNAEIPKKESMVADPVEIYRFYAGFGATGLVPNGTFTRYANYGGGLSLFGGMENPWVRRHSAFVSLSAFELHPEDSRLHSYRMYSLAAGTDYKGVIWKRYSVAPGFSVGYIGHQTNTGLFWDPALSVSAKAMYRIPGTPSFLFVKPSYSFFFEKEKNGRFFQCEVGYQRRIDFAVPKKKEE